MHEMLVTPEAIKQIVDDVWDEVLGLTVTEAASPSTDIQHSDLCVCVHIAGEWNGAVLFWPSPKFAWQASATLFALPETEVTPADIQDGMSEIGNMLAGNLKALLPGPSALSLPTVTCGPQHEVLIRRTRLIAKLEFACGSEPLSVLVLEGVMPAEQASVKS